MCQGAVLKQLAGARPDLGTGFDWDGRAWPAKLDVQEGVRPTKIDVQKGVRPTKVDVQEEKFWGESPFSMDHLGDGALTLGDGALVAAPVLGQLWTLILLLEP